MGLFDNLKRQAAQAARSAGVKAAQDLGDQAKKSIQSAAGKKYTVILQDLPVSMEQLKAMPEADLQKPENTAALAIVALTLYPEDKETALQMLEYLQGPRGITTYDKQFLADRFRDKDYVPRSFFAGATPENNYEPAKPYTLTFFENPYSRNQFCEGYLTLHIRSGGADSPRQLKLRTKPSTGQWFLWEQFLLVDIRTPKSADPWA
jgi:hypothetical protein